MMCGGIHLADGFFTMLAYWLVTLENMSAVVFLASSFHIATIIGVVVTSLIYNKIDILKIHVSF